MRVYKKRTDRQSISEEVLRKAISLVLKNRNEKGFSIRKVAKKYKMSCASLCRYIKRYNEGKNDTVDSSDNEDDMKVLLKKRAGQVFSSENEAIVIQYSHQFGRIMGGLRPKQIRYLAYQCARKFNLKYPPSWDKNKRTGEDWLTHFLKRKKDQFTFLPPPRPLPKGVKVNKKDVETFYESLKQLYDQYKFKGNDIYTMDQIDTSTIILNSSSKSRDIVTIVAAVNAIGNCLPPMLIFPNDRFKEHSAIDGPIDCIGVTSESSAMTEENFITFLKHFVQCAKPDESRPVLLLLENHKTNRLNISVMDICQEEGIVVLSLPAGCEHRLQPLNVAVFDAFRNLCSVYRDEWMKSNEGSFLEVNGLPGIIREAWLRAFTPINITSGFERSGIYPLNPAKFDDKDYGPFDGTHFLACQEEITPQAVQTTLTLPINNNTQPPIIMHDSINGMIGYQTSPAVPIIGDYSTNMTSMIWDRGNHSGWSGVQSI